MTSRETDVPQGEMKFLSGLAVYALIGTDIVFGGSLRDAFLATAALQVLACIVLCWCLFDARLRPFRQSARVMLALIGAGALYCLLQLVPLPWDIWTTLPGREGVAESFRIAGLVDVSQPISLRPDRTLYGLLQLLPALAAFVLIARLPWRLVGLGLPWTVVGLAAFSSALGLGQALAGHEAFFFPYGEIAGQGAPGLFQSANHQPTLLLMALPFAGVLFSRVGGQLGKGDVHQGQAIVIIAALFLLVAGVFQAGSVGGFVLLGPVLLISVFIAMGGGSVRNAAVGLLIVAGGVAAIGYVVLTSPLLAGIGATDLSDDPLGRKKVFEVAWEMTGEHFPWGAGLGAFENAFPAYEKLSTITPSFIAHIHNDYLETLVELGLVGGLVLAGILAWWVVMTIKVWSTSREGGARIRQAASVAVAVVLIHSLFDFPARTEAIACLAAVCAGLMSNVPRWGEKRRGQSDGDMLFQHRHVEL